MCIRDRSTTGNVVKKKTKLKPVVGELYNINSNVNGCFTHQYLGMFTALDGASIDPYGDIGGKKYHVFATRLGSDTVIDCFRSVPVNIRKLDLECGDDFTSQTITTTEKGIMLLW